jgi:DNA-binding ferritin-like protein
MEAFGLFIGTLLQSRTQAQIFHWQTTGEGSYAAHKALQDYYDGIVDIVDGIVESYQGRYGIFSGYIMNNTLKEDNAPTIYFEALAQFVEKVRFQIPQDTYIQNQVDEVVTLIESTKYKLRNLR